MFLQIMGTLICLVLASALFMLKKATPLKRSQNYDPRPINQITYRDSANHATFIDESVKRWTKAMAML